MKSSLIAIILLLGCAYGAYAHIQEQEKRIAAAEKIKAEADKTVAGIKEQEAALRPKADASDKLLAATLATAAEEALEKERKTRRALHEALKADITATNKEKELAGEPRVNAADATLRANIAALDFAREKLAEENTRLELLVQKERAAMPVSQR